MKPPKTATDILRNEGLKPGETFQARVTAAQAADVFASRSSSALAQRALTVTERYQSALAKSALIAPLATPADLGVLVRGARKSMALTQQAFADLAGVGRRFVSELEAGKPTLELGKVIQVCQAAGIDLFARSRS